MNATQDDDRRRWARFFTLTASCSLLLHLVASYRSQGFFQCDEHFQVVEFLSSKLGWTSPSELAWEHSRRMRPWLQPALYFPFAKLSVLLGVEDPFTLAWILRSISALFGWAGLLAFGRCLPLWFESERFRRAALLTIHFFYLVPALNSRTSSEHFSQTFLLLGLTCLLAPGPLGAPLWSPRGTEARGPRPLEPTCLVAGMAFGFAFLSRYQAALLVLGCGAWFFVWGRSRLALCSSVGLGFLVVPGIGMLVDRWGYGVWVFAPWHYFHVNLVEGVAARFGTLPAWGYVELMGSSVVPPFGLLWLATFALSLVALPRHLLTWTVLPFVVFHHAVGHKEARFLFPTLVLALVLAVLLVERAADRARLRDSSGFAVTWKKVSKPLLIALATLNLLGLWLSTLQPTSPRWTLLNELDALARGGWLIETANGFDAVSKCGAEPAFYRGKRRWQRYRPGTPFRTAEADGRAVFYGWSGRPHCLEMSPFATSCSEIAPKWWLSSRLARRVWTIHSLAPLAARVTVHAVYRCRPPQPHPP